jgi:hypothetical protein
MKLASAIDNYFFDVRKFYRDPNNAKKSYDKARELAANEWKIGPHNAACEHDEFVTLLRDEPNLNYETIQKNLMEDFGNEEVSNFVGCAVMVNLLIEENGRISTAPDVIFSFSDLKRIGKESVYGMAFKGRLRGTEDLFVIKTSQRAGPANWMVLHELIVGRRLNQLRKLGIPNFAYVYGSFSCAPPVVDDDGKVLRWCSDEEEKRNYVVYENVKAEKTAQEYVAETLDVRRFASLFLQLSIASSVVNFRFPYTHYDLHTENVLMREPPEGITGEFYIPYTNSKGSTYYVLSDKIATIIDFGMAYVDGYGAPVETPELAGAYTNKRLPIHDIFKFVCFVSYVCFGKGTSQDVKDYLVYALSFFLGDVSEREVVAFLRDQKKNLFNLPDLLVLKDWTVSNFVTHIFDHETADEVITLTPSPSVPIWKYDESERFKSIFERSLEVRPPNLFHLYKLKETDYPMGFSAKEDLTRLSKLVSNEEDKLSEIHRKYAFIPEITTQTYSNPSYLAEFKEFFWDYNRAYMSLMKVEYVVKVLTWYLSNHHNQRAQAVVSKASSLQNDLVDFLELSRPSLRGALDVLTDPVVVKSSNTLIVSDKRFDWYTSAIPALNGLLKVQFVKLPKPPSPKTRTSMITSATGTITRNKTNNL